MNSRRAQVQAQHLSKLSDAVLMIGLKLMEEVLGERVVCFMVAAADGQAILIPVPGINAAGVMEVLSEVDWASAIAAARRDDGPAL